MGNLDKPESHGSTDGKGAGTSYGNGDGSGEG